MLLKALFTADLLTDMQSARRGLETFLSMPVSSDRNWTLKPCLNCSSSPELDELIRNTIKTAGIELSFKTQLKPLICKHSDSDAEGVNDLLQALMSLNDSLMRQ